MKFAVGETLVHAATEDPVRDHPRPHLALGTLAAFLAAAIALILPASAAYAQMRTIPADAKRAEMRHLQEMVIELNGTPVRLAAAAQIRDQSNRIVVPASLEQPALVRYLADPQGYVTRIWILTPAEAAQPDPAR